MVVSVDNLKFRYQSNSGPVLDIPQWVIKAGERSFLYGPSGSGKSTLLNLLAGILLPCTGSIEILGKPLESMRASQRDRWRAEHIGVVFQQFNLIPYLSGLDNIKLATHFCRKKYSSNQPSYLLTALGLSKRLHRLPAAKLSIGQQQRVAIARALINRPELLIVDEPTSALDEKNRNAFMQVLFEQLDLNDTALIFVSHDLTLSTRFDRVEQLSEINQSERVL